MARREYRRSLLQAAMRLREYYLAAADQYDRANADIGVAVLQAHLDALSESERQLRRALQLGFTACQPRLRAQCERTLRDLARKVEQVTAGQRRSEPRPPSLRELYEDLCEAEAEFGELDLDSAGGTIAVRTGQIVLEGIQLGSFRIIFDVNALPRGDRSPAYTIEAIEPSPASSNREIVHPHVDGDYLCAGDATAAIQNAVTQGRLCDFFLLVRSVLETYNPHSAYVELELWEAATCEECEMSTHEDRVSICSRCERLNCEQCISECRRCGRMECYGCLLRSSDPEMYYCAECAGWCSRCRCVGCIDELDEHDRCPACQEQAERDKEQHDHDDHNDRKDDTTPNTNRRETTSIRSVTADRETEHATEEQGTGLGQQHYQHQQERSAEESEAVPSHRLPASPV